MKKYKRLGIVLLLVLLIAAGLLLLKRTASDTAGSMVSFVGIVRTVELTPLMADGPTTYQIEVESEKIVTVSLAPGFSTCDREAIMYPDAVVGDRVAVQGIYDENGSVDICEPGTYTKKA